MIHKISKFNQSYFRFFSKPIFSDFYFNKFIENYYDTKAEILYINNYSGKKNSKIVKDYELKDAIKNNISSFDNDTKISTVFNKRIRKMIDKNLDSKNITISVSINSKKDFNKYSNSDTNMSKSLLDFIDNFINYQNTKITNFDDDLNMNKINNNKKNIKENISRNKLILSTDNKSFIISNNNSLYLRNKENMKNEQNPINNKKHEMEKEENIRLESKNDMNDINDDNKIKKNYIEINNPRVIYSNRQTNKINNINNYSPLYKKPKPNLIINKNNDRAKISNNNLFNKQLSILNINTLKKTTKNTKFKFYIPQNSKNKYTLNNNNHIKSFSLKQAESIKSNKESSESSNIYINGKPELPSINLEKSSEKKYDKKIVLSNKNKKITSNLNLYINQFRNINFHVFKNQSNQNSIKTQRHNLNKLSLIPKEINQNIKNLISNFSEDKLIHKTINLNSINIEKNKLNYIKNNFMKKLRPSYSLNKEKESFNSTIKQLDIIKSNKVFNRNSLKNRIKMHTKFIIYGIQKKNNNINYTNRLNKKYKKIIYPINLMKKSASQKLNF